MPRKLEEPGPGRRRNDALCAHTGDSGAVPAPLRGMTMSRTGSAQMGWRCRVVRHWHCEAFPLHNIGRLPATWQMRPLLSRSSQAAVLADPNLNPAHLVMLVKVRSALTRSRTHPPRSTAVQIAAIRKASEAHLKGFLAEHVGVQEEPPRLIVYGEDYSQYGKSGDVSCHVHRGTHGTHGHTDHNHPTHKRTSRTNARQLLGRYPDTLF